MNSEQQSRAQKLFANIQKELFHLTGSYYVNISKFNFASIPSANANTVCGINAFITDDGLRFKITATVDKEDADVSCEWEHEFTWAQLEDKDPAKLAKMFLAVGKTTSESALSSAQEYAKSIR